MSDLLRHVWVVPLLVNVVFAIRLRQRAMARIHRDRTHAAGYRRLFWVVLVFGSLPWLVMGLGILIGSADSALDYLRPHQASAWVVLWYGTMLLLWGLWILWIFLLGGAEELAANPVFLGSRATTARKVKLSTLAWTIFATFLVLFVFDVEIGLFSGDAGNGYRTTFVVYDGFLRLVALAALFIAVGIGVLIAALARLRRQREQAKPIEPQKRRNARFMLVWSVLFLVGSGAGFTLNLRRSYGLVRVYAEGQAEVVRGEVRVLREQPWGGHTEGDLVEIGGVELTIDHFSVTPAYRKTISHGGVLREGQRARVWHHDGLILRVDVPTEDTR